MALEEHLLPDETITSQHGPFYATPRRIIRYTQTPEAEQVHELPYTRLSGMELVKLPRHRLMIMGTVVAIGGAFVGLTWGLIFTTIIAIPGGIAMVIVGGIGREAYYQLQAHNMTKEEEHLWRVDYRHSQHFINTLHTILGDRPDIERW